MGGQTWGTLGEGGKRNQDIYSRMGGGIPKQDGYTLNAKNEEGKGFVQKRKRQQYSEKRGAEGRRVTARDTGGGVKGRPFQQ